MQSNQPQFHGSDLETIAAYYHISQNDIINYSSNVNPLGLSDAFQTSVAQHIIICFFRRGKGGIYLTRHINQWYLNRVQKGL